MDALTLLTLATLSLSNTNVNDICKVSKDFDIAMTQANIDVADDKVAFKVLDELENVSDIYRYACAEQEFAQQKDSDDNDNTLATY